MDMIKKILLVFLLFLTINTVSYANYNSQSINPVQNIGSLSDVSIGDKTSDVINALKGSPYNEFWKYDHVIAGRVLYGGTFTASGGGDAEWMYVKYNLAVTGSINTDTVSVIKYSQSYISQGVQYKSTLNALIKNATAAHGKPKVTGSTYEWVEPEGKRLTIETSKEDVSCPYKILVKHTAKGWN